MGVDPAIRPTEKSHLAVAHWRIAGLHLLDDGGDGGFDQTHWGLLEWRWGFEAGRALLAPHASVLVGAVIHLRQVLRQLLCCWLAAGRRKLQLRLCEKVRLQVCWVWLAGALLEAAWQARAYPMGMAGGSEVAY